MPKALNAGTAAKSDPSAGERRLQRLDIIARLLDSRWRIPGIGVRFGADALLSLLPAIGPIASTAVSAYLIWEARRLGISTGMLLRMIGNLGLDAVISAVPLAGSVGDVFFRANLRNMALLRHHLEKTAPAIGGGGPAE
ncbi:MAG: DUF4112 domain-containing protein [Acetobacteraceae bacterium]|nr:MAG: DUF4112 domain-containing protein [Acetobacteraceae bacterium]